MQDDRGRKADNGTRGVVRACDCVCLSYTFYFSTEWSYIIEFPLIVFTPTLNTKSRKDFPENLHG